MSDTLIILLDTSGSMYNSVYRHRIIPELLDFIREQQPQSLQIYAFTEKAWPLLNLGEFSIFNDDDVSLITQVVSHALDNAFGTTCIYDVLMDMLNNIDNYSNKYKTIKMLVITDGIDTHSTYWKAWHVKGFIWEMIEENPGKYFFYFAGIGRLVRDMGLNLGFLKTIDLTQNRIEDLFDKMSI